MQDHTILMAARVCHETNRAYCQTLLDYSQVPWDDAPDWQKKSAVNGVKAIVHNPRVTPEDLHAGWTGEKIDDGWVYGPVKDVEKKQHPCLVPYGDLPEEQRKKDALFGAVARVMLGIVPAHG